MIFYRIFEKSAKKNTEIIAENDSILSILYAGSSTTAYQGEKMAKNEVLPPFTRAEILENRLSELKLALQIAKARQNPQLKGKLYIYKSHETNQFRLMNPVPAPVNQVAAPANQVAAHANQVAAKVLIGMLLIIFYIQAGKMEMELQ